MWYIYCMGKHFLLYRAFFAVLIFCLGVLPLASQENDAGEQAGEAGNFFGKISWFAEGSVLFFPEDNGLESDPMPVLPSPGVGASYPITGLFRLELTLDLYLTHYGYSYTLGRAVPDAIENRTARVIGFILGFQAAWYFDLTSFMTLRLYCGPAADLRIVLVAADLDNESSAAMDDIRRRTDEVRSYFWSSGRWFLPVVGLGTDFTINPRFKLGIDFRVWAPMYRLWSGEDLPAVEGWRFGPGVRFTIR